MRMLRSEMLQPTATRSPQVAAQPARHVAARGGAARRRASRTRAYCRRRRSRRRATGCACVCACGWRLPLTPVAALSGGARCAAAETVANTQRVAVGCTQVRVCVRARARACVQGAIFTAPLRFYATATGMGTKGDRPYSDTAGWVGHARAFTHACKPARPNAHTHTKTKRTPTHTHTHTHAHTLTHTHARARTHTPHTQHTHAHARIATFSQRAASGRARWNMLNVST
jgi:hypothetical protein